MATDAGARRAASPSSPSSSPAAGSPPEARGDPAARVLRQFRTVFNAVKSHFREVEKKAGVAGAQVWALSIVRDHPGIGVGGLAQAMDVHQSTASNLLRSLMEQGLVASSRSAGDRRAVELRISPQGLKVLQRAPGPTTGVLPQALAALDTATLRRLERDLGRLVEQLQPAPDAGGIPLGQPEPPARRRGKAAL